MTEAAHGVRLTVAYDGTDFHGYQSQTGQRTVQGSLEAAIESITGEVVRARAAGRTDAGVHALAQVVAFDSSKLLPPRSWAMALNAKLPDDVSVQDADACEPGYNPRFDSMGKTYRYVMDTGVTRHPLFRDRVWHLGPQLERSFVDRDRLEQVVTLDLNAMRQAAKVLVGKHDFRAFRAADDDRDNTIRTLTGVDVIENFTGHARLIAIEVSGDAFMKNMVRIIAGTLFDAGRKRINEEQVAALLSEHGQRQNAGPTAPACGLTLVEVRLGRIRAQASPST